eukprot:5320656-Pyramimonas_sp.AAC.1
MSEFSIMLATLFFIITKTMATCIKKGSHFQALEDIRRLPCGLSRFWTFTFGVDPSHGRTC